MTQTGKWIGQAWQLVIRHFWAFVLFTILFMIAIMAGSFITSGIAIIILFGPLQAGVYAMILHLIKTDEFDANQIKRGFNRFSDTLLAYLVLYAFSLVISCVFIIPLIVLFLMFIPILEGSASAQPGLLAGLIIGGGGLILLFSLASLILSTLYLFPWLLIVDRKLPFWEAMEASRKTVQKSLPGFIGFMLLLGVINFFGMLLCGIGFLVTFPLQLTATVFAYRDLWPEEEATALLGPSPAEPEAGGGESVS